MMKEIYSVVEEYFEFCTEKYIKLAMHIRGMINAIESEMQGNPAFRNLINSLNSNVVAQRLQLGSYINRPLQRIQRVPLLFRTILKFTEPGSKEHEACLKSLESTTRVGCIN